MALKLLSTISITYLALLVVHGQELSQNDSISTDTLTPNRSSTYMDADSLQVNDSLSLDTNRVSFSYKITPDPLESEVHYDARDSIIMNLKLKKAYLYGDAHLDYGSMSMDAEYIEFDWGKKLLLAEGVQDSVGNVIGKPVLIDGEETFDADKIIYNYESKKGKIYMLTTQAGEGYVHGKEVKKDAEDNLYIRDAKFVVCCEDDPNPVSPDYYIRISKMKIVKDKMMVAGPSNVVLEDVPTPIFIPFGIFPINKKQASGILFPTYGNSPGQGYFLRDGGYYFGISDYLDLEVRADFYSRGTWGIKPSIRYKKRYKRSGSLAFSYINNKLGIPETPSESESRNFEIVWSHKQDPKARPNSNFGANVNIVSNNYYTNNSYDIDKLIQSDINSSVNYRVQFPRSPFSLQANLRHNQNLQTKIVTLDLPDIALNMNRIYPFKSKVQVGSKKWYEKITLNYNTSFKNRIQAADSVLFEENLTDNMSNGMKHTATMNFDGYKILKYLNWNILPSLSYREYWYIQTIERKWDTEANSAITDTIRGFATARDFSGLETNLNTTLYGFAAFKKGKVAAIRHSFTPEIAARYKFDFSKDFWGYYDRYLNESNGQEISYSRFEGGIQGGPSQDEFGGLDFSVENRLSMKVRTTQIDSTEEDENLKKVTLLDQLSAEGDYNFLKDSLNLSTISIRANSELFNKFTINASANFDPYQLNQDGIRINTLEWERKNLARLTKASLNINTSFQSKKKSTISNEYYNIFWKISPRYNIQLRKNFNAEQRINETIITETVGLRIDLRLTRNWSVDFTSGYNITDKIVTATKLSIKRDMHCWQMDFWVIPTGPSQSYNITIRPKANILKDLEIKRERGRFDQIRN